MTDQELMDMAKKAAEYAYVPYSKFPVGAALECSDGTIFTGCNVENAGYGVTLCAECGLVSSLLMGGGGRLVAFTCVNGEGDVITPCGRCRQLLNEHGGPALVLETPAGLRTLDEMLPQAFGPADLA